MSVNGIADNDGGCIGEGFSEPFEFTPAGIPFEYADYLEKVFTGFKKPDEPLPPIEGDDDDDSSSPDSSELDEMEVHELADAAAVADLPVDMPLADLAAAAIDDDAFAGEDLFGTSSSSDSD